MLMKNVQLPGASSYDSEMAMHTSTSNIDISLSRGFQKHLSDPTLAHGLLDHGKDRFFSVNGIGMSVIIISESSKIFHTYQLKCCVQQLISQYCYFAVYMQNLV